MANDSSGQQLPSETVRFCLAAYSLDTIKKAAYRFLDRFITDIRVEGDDVVCTITFLGPLSPEEVRAAVADLRAEVLDQDLRKQIAQETASIRNTILALAFSATKLQDRE